MHKPTITFETLRLIAETASGLRDQDTWFVVRETPAGTGYSWQHTPVEAGDDTVVIYCAPVMDAVSPVDHATIGVRKDTVDLMNITVPAIFPHLDSGPFEADAVFWSVAAVEKFLVPYYASVYGDQGPAHAKAVMDVLLVPDSDPKGFADEEMEERAFAVVHLPSSEYVSEEVPHVAVLRAGGRHSFVRHAGADQGSSARTNGSRETYARSPGR